MHRLWHRPTHFIQKPLEIPFWSGWPWQIALDRIERIVSQNLFWQFIGRIEKPSTSNLIDLKQLMSNKYLASSIFRVERDMPHLTSLQKEQRVALLNWMARTCEARLATCQRQWLSLNPHQPDIAFEGISQPKLVIDTTASGYLEKLRGWIEKIYDQKKIDDVPPQPLSQTSSAQLGDISIGLDLFIVQLEIRTTELMVEKYIKRCNWGRFFVKMSLLSPVISLIARKIFAINAASLTLGAAGLGIALGIWLVSNCFYSKEVSHTSRLICDLLDLSNDLVHRERSLSVEEWAEFYARSQARSSTPNTQQQNSAQSQKADRAQESQENSGNDRQIAPGQERVEAKSRFESERLKELHAKIEYYEKLHQEFLDKKRIYEDSKKDLLWLKAKVQSMGIQIDYSQGFARLVFPLRIKGPEHRKNLMASQ